MWETGGFEWLTEAHQDYWRLIDFMADEQYAAWLTAWYSAWLSDTESEQGEHSHLKQFQLRRYTATIGVLGALGPEVDYTDCRYDSGNQFA